MNKQGIELAINFLAMLMLGLAVFGLGLIFVSKLFSQAEDIRLNMDKQTEEQLESLLDRDDKVVIPIQVRDTEPGKVALFALGVLNVLQSQSGSTTPFTFTVDCTAGIGWNDVPITPSPAPACSSWVVPKVLPVLGSLTQNEKKKVVFGILPPKGIKRGIYTFKVEVKANGVAYDDAPKQIRVRIN